MKSAIIMKHGDLNAIEISDLPAPKVNDYGVLIKMRAAALNHLDIWVRKGIPGLNLDLPHTLGADGAGEITAVGKNVKLWKPGDQVVINPAISCNKCMFCRQGEQSLCSNIHLLGEHSKGTFAEYVVVPQTNVYKKPSILSWEESAAYPLVFVTAWRMLFTRAQIKPGESILILGIGGGVALAALQIAKFMNCHIAVTSSSEEKLAKAKKMGAELCLNYNKDDIVKGVRDWSCDIHAEKYKSELRGVDIVVDSIGGEGWSKSLRCLARGGRLVTCGATAGGTPKTHLQRIFWDQLSVLGSTMGSSQDFEQMHRLVCKGVLKPVIDSTYPLEQIKKAQSHMEQRKQFGKIVLTMNR